MQWRTPQPSVCQLCRLLWCLNPVSQIGAGRTLMVCSVVVRQIRGTASAAGHETGHTWRKTRNQEIERAERRKGNLFDCECGGGFVEGSSGTRAGSRRLQTQL